MDLENKKLTGLLIKGGALVLFFSVDTSAKVNALNLNSISGFFLIFIKVYNWNKIS
jgi:hypothetical protein